MQVQGRSCQEGPVFLACQFSGREGISRVLRLGDGWERAGSSAFLRLVLQ